MKNIPEVNLPEQSSISSLDPSFWVDFESSKKSIILLKDFLWKLNTLKGDSKKIKKNTRGKFSRAKTEKFVGFLRLGIILE